MLDPRKKFYHKILGILGKIRIATICYKVLKIKLVPDLSIPAIFEKRIMTMMTMKGLISTNLQLQNSHGAVKHSI